MECTLWSRLITGDILRLTRIDDMPVLVSKVRDKLGVLENSQCPIPMHLSVPDILSNLGTAGKNLLLGPSHGASQQGE
jgi:hypothetical protein